MTAHDQTRPAPEGSLVQACRDLAAALERHQEAVARHAREIPDPSEETLAELETSYFDLIAAAGIVSGQSLEAASDDDLFTAKAA
ncbi:hypothetical protein [Salinarimonas soli]|uniref:Uncharacterized protein n=1 Tax=Salinarimonas soli TaxID=1638099 RepID=A0A5B2VUH0_9HYPH|nr:hypothetical protein [Salinarimonas soli]KAA2242320.1 hypothetical protein F0L46_03280 [Salinarimonas soli]